MKRLSAIILSAVMALSVCACGGGAKPAETTTAAVETQAVEVADNQQSAWVEGVEVDEFGDVVADSENIILKTISIGDFSNTATSSSNLKVEIVLTPKKTNIFCFTLLEYGDTRASYSDNSKISMKVKIGEKKTEYKLMGKAPNGTLFLGINNNDSNDIFNALYYGDDVRCIIYIDNSQYNFTIPSNGFQELCKEEQKKIDAINEKYRIKDIASVVNNLLISKDGSAKLFEAYEYLKKNRDEFVLMTDDDIKNEIDGEFYYMSLSRPKNNK